MPGGAPVRFAVEESQIPELRQFLTQAFDKPPDTPAFTAACLYWKYFQTRADWAAPRSWALKDDDGQLVAHLGVGPSTLILPTTTVSTIMMIDWAASRSAPRGTGSRLMEEVCLGMPMQVIVGGTTDSQRAFHRLGYARVGTLETYWRTLAPWRRFRETPSPVQPWHVRRLIEDWASDARTKLFGRRWTLERIESFEGYRSLLRESDDCGWTRCSRTPEMLDYMLKCPSDCKAFVFRYRDKPVGYVFLSRNDRQVRIADLWIASNSENRWKEALAVASVAARTYPQALELTVTCSSETLRRAMRPNSFECRIKRPIWLKDPSELMRGAGPLHLQALEADSWFL